MSIYSNLRLPFSFQKVAESLKKYGFFKSIRLAYVRLYDIYFDKKNGTDTVSMARLEHIDVGVEGQKIGNQYQPNGILNTQKVLKHIAKYGKTGFVDFGAGKGQVLLSATAFNFTSIKGIEFSADLCKIAKQNVLIFSKKHNSKARVEVICTDATQYKIQAEDDVFFFYDPFKESIIEQVYQNITHSVKENPREVLVVFCRPRAKHLLQKYFTHINSFQLDEFDCEIYKAG